MKNNSIVETGSKFVTQLDHGIALFGSFSIVLNGIHGDDLHVLATGHSVPVNNEVKIYDINTRTRRIGVCYYSTYNERPGDNCGMDIAVIKTDPGIPREMFKNKLNLYNNRCWNVTIRDPKIGDHVSVMIKDKDENGKEIYKHTSVITSTPSTYEGGDLLLQRRFEMKAVEGSECRIQPSDSGSLVFSRTSRNDIELHGIITHYKPESVLLDLSTEDRYSKKRWQKESVAHCLPFTKIRDHLETRFGRELFNQL